MNKEKENNGKATAHVELVNLTPHAVKVNIAGKEITIPPSGQILRLPETIGNAENIVYNGTEIPVVEKRLSVGNLPPQESGKFYIVSLPIAQTTLRSDFLVPDDLVRDSNGQPLYARRLARIIREG